jgi:hypothetical protein
MYGLIVSLRVCMSGGVVSGIMVLRGGRTFKRWGLVAVIEEATVGRD